jgi:predicted dinucleotide-binding enzyme
MARCYNRAMAKPVAILGSGAVGQALARGFLKHGYGVVVGTAHPDKRIDWSKQASGSDPAALRSIPVTTYELAAKAAELAVLATKGAAAEAVVKAIAPHLAGKIVLDATNPLADEAPENGVLKLFTASNESLMERLQRTAPQARFVKAFSCIGSGLMVDPDVGQIKPSMFICGNDAAARQEVTRIVEQFGFDAEDMGGVEAARAIEPLAMLWCIPGFLRNDWNHAFKMLRK